MGKIMVNGTLGGEFIAKDLGNGIQILTPAVGSGYLDKNLPYRLRLWWARRAIRAAGKNNAAGKGSPPKRPNSIIRAVVLPNLLGGN